VACGPSYSCGPSNCLSSATSLQIQPNSHIRDGDGACFGCLICRQQFAVFDGGFHLIRGFIEDGWVNGADHALETRMIDLLGQADGDELAIERSIFDELRQYHSMEVTATLGSSKSRVLNENLKTFKGLWRTRSERFTDS
jgi:hypothetical protein